MPRFDTNRRLGTVLAYCDTGTLSAQAGYENVRILQGGHAEWKAKGGFEANARSRFQAIHPSLFRGGPS